MDRDQEQLRLQALFSELRREDEHRAPSFRRCVEGADGRVEDGAMSVGRWVMAAAMILACAGIVGVTFFSRVHHGGAVATHAPIVAPDARLDVDAMQSISTWQSPTAFLLELPVLDSKSSSPVDKDWMIPSRSRDQRPLF